MHRRLLFDNDWMFCKFPNRKRVFQEVVIPHTWNALDGQDGGNDYYRGECLYKKRFANPGAGEDEQVFIEFEGVNSSCRVLINGCELGVHQGGYSSFRLEITQHLTDENVLEIYVDNSKNELVYPQVADFTFYGGIYRDVWLVIVNSTHFEFDSVDVRPSLQLPATGLVHLEGKLSGACDGLSISILDAQGCQVGRARSKDFPLDLTIEDVKRWEGLENPYLYTVELSAMQDMTVLDQISLSIGFRTFHVDPYEGFFLNGRKYPLRGVSRHQDRLGVGNALTKAMHEEDILLIKEVGANCIRLAHYQHSQCFLDLCDRHGFIVWEEIPYITQHMENGNDNLQSQMRELITQNRNHASICFWALSNEITAGGHPEGLVDEHKALYSLCKELDPARPVGIAHAFMQEPRGEMLHIADLNAYNLYYGWYIGEIRDNWTFLDSFHMDNPESPIGLTEYGADANIRLHSQNPRKGDYSEEYQCLFHERMCEGIRQRDYLWCTFLWNMFDFGADAREEGGQKGINGKGLVTFDRKTRKDSFYVYKAFFSKEPFVHIAGRRYAKRTEAVSNIKVYTNLCEVELFSNSISQGSKKGDKIISFDVRLESENRLIARTCDSSGRVFTDEMTIFKVDEAESSYVLRIDDQVHNWFEGLERSDNNPGHGFSMNDKLGEIAKADGGMSFIKSLYEAQSPEKSGIAAIVQVPFGMFLSMVQGTTVKEYCIRANISSENTIKICSDLKRLIKE